MTIKINEYTLPSGMAGFNVSDNEYTHPQSKRDISTALRESLHCNFKQQARIAELEAEVELLKGCNESPRIPPAITAGCYCTDIETESQYIETCEALVKLGCLASGFYSYPDSGMCSYRDEYLINGNVGWVEPSMEISNGIYHAKGDLRHCFTTLVSHRDIIKAAEGL